jgi:hypothetical protein
MSDLGLKGINIASWYNMFSTHTLFSCKAVKCLCKTHYWKDTKHEEHNALDYLLLILIVNEEFMNCRQFPGVFIMTSMGKRH